jgi:hypothetical protein
VLRVREIYAKGLIAGMTMESMRHALPGFILDMYMHRLKHDVSLVAPQAARRMFGG